MASGSLSTSGDRHAFCAQLDSINSIHCISGISTMDADGLLTSSPGLSGPPPAVVLPVRNIPGVIEVFGKLGGGCSSEVFDCTFEGIEENVAVKVMHMNMDQAVSREVQALAALHHPNLVQLYHVIEGSPSGLVLELCKGGNLHNFLHRPLHQEVLLHLGLGARTRAALDVARATEFVHSKGYIHRDIKPGNCFLLANFVTSGMATDFPPLKLGDLGFARGAVAEPGESFTRGMGTIRYMAPEVLMSGTYSTPADIFSCGILLNELQTGEMPYCGLKRSDAVLASAICTQNHRPSSSHLANSSEPAAAMVMALAAACWNAAPELRPSASSLVAQLSEIANFVS